MNKDSKPTKDVEPDCMLKSRFSLRRLRDIVPGLKEPRRKLIIDRGWGILLDIGSFSAPKGLLEWIVLKIDAELGEFRNPRNKTSILFNKEMVIKALGLPRGTRPVVLTGDHEESPYREFYKIEYRTAGRRAPISNAEKMLENAALDGETWFRTFFLVVIGTYFFPGTSIMLPLEYLGSLGDSSLVCEYDWAEQIFRHTMSEIKSFQEKMRKAAKDGNIKPLWVGGCLPWIAIVYMDHLDFPESTLLSHRINYTMPRASHVSDNDFNFVMKHDRNRLTLKSNTYGARPFRPFNLTPYANENEILGNTATLSHNLPQQNAAAKSSHLVQDEPQQPTGQTNNLPEGLPDYMKGIYEKHNSVWMKDVERATTRLTKIHNKRMSEFASELFAAVTSNTTTPHENSLSPVASTPVASTPIASPPRPSSPILHTPRDDAPFLRDDVNNPDPSNSKQTLSTQFWEEASRIADMVEQSSGKTRNATDHPPTCDQAIDETARAPRRGEEIECPSFDLLPAGETWTQHLASANKPPPHFAANISSPDVDPPNNTSGNAHLGSHPIDVDKTVNVAPTTELQSPLKESVDKTPTKHCGQSASREVGKNVGVETATEQPTSANNGSARQPDLHASHSKSTFDTLTNHVQYDDCGQSSHSVDYTISTQTQDKKNRKKRAFLGINTETNKKKLKKLKATDDSKEVYGKYILKRCVKPPLPGEQRPHFVDFGEYHISYEHFREALKPRGKIDTHVMELFIRHFNLIVNIPTTSEPMCTKFAFSQSLTAKLTVSEDKFDPQSCLKEFKEAYKVHHLKTKDMLYFAIVDNGHWVLLSINMLHRQVNVLDSMMSAKNNNVYEKAHLLVNNFIKLASAAGAFPKTNFGQFVQVNPQELRQQTTLFDCGVFVMLFMKQWDGKSMKPFGLEMIDHRMVITHMLLTSDLNEVDPSWVLIKK